MSEAQSLLQGNDLAGAEQRLREALTLDPATAPAHATLGILLTAAQRFDEALEHFRAAEHGDAISGHALQTYVRVLIERARYKEAEAAAETAVRANPQSYESWSALGLACHAAHRYEDALASYDQAGALGPMPDADLHTARARTLQNMGRLGDALAEFDRALAIRPGDALARFHRSLVLLAWGAYDAGWPHYEMRLLSAELQAQPAQRPRWHPARGGGTVLVRSEQGLGDQIMFASCLPDLLRSGLRCVIECDPQLEKLFGRSFAPAGVYAAAGDRRIPESAAPEGIDSEIPIGSLPLHFRRRVTDFPAHGGYLHAAEDRVAVWRERLNDLKPGLKIGLSWRGGTHASRASLRSIRLEALQPLLDVPWASFVSVQYGPAAPAELAAFAQESGVAIRHYPEATADYDETAALVTALDLTIAVCTSVVHLAGALGRPVWVLAPKNAEWRYGTEGAHMHWYPSARLFRQLREGDWDSPIGAVRAALQQAARATADETGAMHDHSTLRARAAPKVE